MINLPSKIISIIIQKYKKINKDNGTIRIFRPKSIKNITNQMQVDFCSSIILNNDIEITNLEIQKPIQTYLLEIPEEPESNGKFFYRNEESLKKFMAFIHAALIINLPLCILEDPGVGKTDMIRDFGRIRGKKNN